MVGTHAGKRAERTSVLLLVIALAAGFTLAAYALRTPTPQPIEAPAEVFSAARALEDVAWIARAPHPTGSAEAARVRDRLVERLHELALVDIEIQHSRAFHHDIVDGLHRVGGAHVANVIARVPGQARDEPAVLLMAHYDSVPNSPGAADNGIGVASMLEIARVLRSTGTPRRDVILLFTDAEEAGLLGARAFFSQHALAQRVGVVLNLEARGSSGRALMFETGPFNDAVIRRYAATRGATANSLTAFVYRHMPNGTDFSVATERGLPGLNFAVIGTQFDYHAATATPEHVSPASLQHLGEQVLAATRALSEGEPLMPATDDAVYSDLLGTILVVHAPAMGWWLLLLAAILIAAQYVRARRHGELSVADVAAGAALPVLLLCASAVFARLAFRLLGGGSAETLAEGRGLLAQFPLFMAGEVLLVMGVSLLGCVALRRNWPRRAVVGSLLVVGVLCSARGGMDVAGASLSVLAAVLAAGVLGRPRSRHALIVGALLLGLLLALLAQVLAPALTPLLLWVLLLAAALALLADRTAVHRAAVLLVAIPGVAHLAYFGHPLFVGVGFGMPEVLGIPVLLAAVLLSPLLLAFADTRRAAAWVCVVLVVAVVLLVNAGRDQGSERYPQASEVMHLAPEQGPHHRISTLSALDSWTRAALAETGGMPKRGEPAAQLPQAWFSPTRIAKQQPSQFEWQVVGAVPGATARLRIRPAPGARELRLLLRSDVTVTEVALDGEPVPLLIEPGEWSRLRWQAMPAEGLMLSWTTDALGSIEIRSAAIVDGWPTRALPLPERPATVMPWGLSDSTLILDEARFSW